MAATRVLLVDDSIVLRRLASATLTAVGDYRIDEAGDGVEGLELLADNVYDVIITDYYMPSLDGIEFVRRIRARESGSRTPILMVTTEHDPYVENEALNAGVDAFLLKPLDPRDLRSVMADFARAPRSDAAEGLADRLHGLNVQALLDGYPYPAMILTATHDVVAANSAFWNLEGSGLTDDGVRCASVMHADGQVPHACPLVEAARTNSFVEREIVEGGMRCSVCVYPLEQPSAGSQRLFLHTARPMDEDADGGRD